MKCTHGTPLHKIIANNTDGTCSVTFKYLSCGLMHREGWSRVFAVAISRGQKVVTDYPEEAAPTWL